MKLRVGCVLVGFLSLVFSMAAQTSGSSTSSTSHLPRLVKFSGTLTGVAGSPASGVVGVTFALYSEPSGGAPLWLETQNVQPDKNGHYTVLLGSTKPEGLPVDLFVSEQAQWLGVKPEGQNEQPRVLLMSVPYAMKALDAETVGGRPASSFVLAPAVSSSSDQGVLPPGTITGSGTADFVPLFTGATTIGNSKIFQTVAGNVGIATTTPAAKLDVKGTGDVRDTLTLFPKSTHPVLSVHGTALSIDNTGKVTFVAGQTFPGTGTVTSVGSGAGLTGGPITTSGTLSIANAGVTNAMIQNSSLTVTANSPLTGGGAVSLGGSTSLGLKSCSNNQVLQFISGAWTCANAGTVSSVGLTAPGSDFTVSGSPITSSGTLGLSWTVAPTNANTANSIVKRDGSGSFSAGVVAAAAVNAADASLSHALVVNSTSGNPLVSGTSFNSATAIEGVASATTGAGWGIEGVTASTDDDAYGVYGYASSTGGGTAKGVYGQSLFGSGVFGQYGPTRSSEGNPNLSAGTWGDGGCCAYGVIGTVDNYTAGLFDNLSSGDYTLYVSNDQPGGPVFAAVNNGTGAYCAVAGGNLNCTGSKNAVVPIDGGKRIVAMSAIESPQNWFEDAGSAELVNGSAVVTLDPDFIQTVNTGMDYKVFPVPNGDCKGLYITHKTATSFEVRELGGGTANIAFDYRIMVLRKNYENVRFADHTNDPDLRKVMERMKRASPQANPEAKPAKAPVNTSTLARPSTAAPGTTESSKTVFKTPSH